MIRIAVGLTGQIVIGERSGCQQGSRHLWPLRFELEALWSARRGTYRVIYRIDEGKRLAQIITIDHQAEVFRRARRG